MNNTVLVEVVDGAENLSDTLRRVLLRELALFADTIEQLSTSRKLRHNVELILHSRRQYRNCPEALTDVPSTRTSR